MVWVIVVVAIIVLGIGAYAGTGKLGEMPPVVTDTPRGTVPEGPVDEEFLEGLTIPRVAHGYDTTEVDAFLQSWVEGRHQGRVEDVSFPVVRDGYDMATTDHVLDRMGRNGATRASQDPLED